MYLLAQSKYDDNALFQLTSYLFNGYDNLTRPVKSTYTTTFIEFDLSMLQLLKVVSLNSIFFSQKVFRFLYYVFLKIFQIFENM
jgi:hypothetical protein